MPITLFKYLRLIGQKPALNFWGEIFILVINRELTRVMDWICLELPRAIFPTMPVLSWSDVNLFLTIDPITQAERSWTN